MLPVFKQYDFLRKILKIKCQCAVQKILLLRHIQVPAVTSQGSFIKSDQQRSQQFIHFIYFYTFISTFIIQEFPIVKEIKALLFTFKHPFPTHILHQDLLTDSPLNREELNPQSRSKSPFLIPPSILHKGRILLVLRGINKSVSVIMIIILMISLKQFHQLNCLKMIILLNFLCVTLVFSGDQYICYLGISLVLPQFPASFSPVNFSVLYYSFLSFKIGRREWIYVHLELVYIVVQQKPAQHCTAIFLQ